jgi:uncharacterized protein YqhQ
LSQELLPRGEYAMSDEYLEPITPEIVEEPKNNTNKILIIVAVVIVLCICACICLFVVVPALLGPTVGNVFSEVIDEMMLTPMP